MGRCAEFFANFDGTPTEVHWTEDYEDTFEGKQKLFNMMMIADSNDWIMTTSVLKRMKKHTVDAPKGVLR